MLKSAAKLRFLFSKQPDNSNTTSVLRWRLSLNQRLLLVSCVIVTFFLGGTGLVLDQAFLRSAEQARLDRLKAHSDTLLAGADVIDQQLILSKKLPDALLQPDSGLYAEIIDQNASLWRSPSLLNRSINIGNIVFNTEGNFTVKVNNTIKQFVYYRVINWENTAPMRIEDIAKITNLDVDTNITFTLMVAENNESLAHQVSEYSKNLWRGMLLVTLLLLIAQTIVVRWGLAPLRQLEAQVESIERGQTAMIHGKYPSELYGLAQNINRLIENDSNQLTHYRKTIEVLAHSLKNPLAFLRSTIESSNIDQQADLLAEVDQMSHKVQVQLKRAASHGRMVFSLPIKIAPLINELFSAMAKIYHEKQVSVNYHVDEQAAFSGLKEDFTEICGNLVDNAYKWCEKRVSLHIVCSHAETEPFQIKIIVEDDGVGVPCDAMARVWNRGERFDQQIPGHGIGLAIVYDLVKTYNGSVQIQTSSLGGAKFIVELPNK